MSKEIYEITKEAVLKAAKECPDWERGLKAMFPKAFEEEGHDVDLSNFDWVKNPFICVRSYGELKNKAFWLCDSWWWIITRGDTNSLNLIPTRKKK